MHILLIFLVHPCNVVANTFCVFFFIYLTVLLILTYSESYTVSSLMNYVSYSSHHIDIQINNMSIHCIFKVDSTEVLLRTGPSANSLAVTMILPPGLSV